MANYEFFDVIFTSVKCKSNHGDKPKITDLINTAITTTPSSQMDQSMIS
jgi:hypothetical protein